MAGRKRRLSRYLSSALKRVKNIHTRRTNIATVTRDLKKIGMSKTNKRLKNK